MYFSYIYIYIFIIFNNVPKWPFFHKRTRGVFWFSKCRNFGTSPLESSTYLKKPAEKGRKGKKGGKIGKVREALSGKGPPRKAPLFWISVSLQIKYLRFLLGTSPAKSSTCRPPFLEQANFSEHRLTFQALTLFSAHFGPIFLELPLRNQALAPFSAPFGTNL